MTDIRPSKPWVLRSLLVALTLTMAALLAQVGPLPSDTWLKLGIASSRVFYALAVGILAFVVAVFVFGRDEEPSTARSA